MKVVINTCYGGYSISDAALFKYAEIKGITLYPVMGDFDTLTYWTVPADQQPSSTPNNWHSMTLEERNAWNKKYTERTLTPRDIPRNDPTLIQVIEELGMDNASGTYASLKVVEIPDGVDYEIEEYDGLEHIAEKRRTWA